ncbi:MAG: hypothetical protein QOJ19_3053 [Acidimicrobiia bacterium]|nr:hypothetical protein [Acidimicrobiia bacterium]
MFHSAELFDDVSGSNRKGVVRTPQGDASRMKKRVPRLLMVTTVPVTLTAFLLPYAAYLRRKGWGVDAATAIDSSDLNAHFDTVYDIPWSRSIRNPRGLAVATRQIRRVLTENDYDVVHVHTPIASFVTRAVCGSLPAKRRPRIVYTAHGFHFHPDGHKATNKAFEMAEKLASRWCDRLLVINQTDFDAAVRLKLAPRGQVLQFPGIGVDLDWYRPSAELMCAAQELRSQLGIKQDDVVFSDIAEMTPRKNHETVLRAFALANDARYHLVLAGDGELRQELEAEVVRIGVADRVHFLGKLRDVRPLLLASAASILPSRREGLPRVVLESLAMGIPMIGSRIRGITELIGDDGGAIVDADDAQGMAEAMHRFARTELGPALPPSVAERMRDYSIENLLELHENLYCELMSGALQRK